MRIAPEGWIVIVPFVLVCAAISGGMVLLLGPGGYGVAFICLLLILWCLWFFRDPHRAPAHPDDADAVISPADARILKVDASPLPPELAPFAPEMPTCVRVVMFLNVFNVHVNRVVVGGTVEKVVYTKGKFCSANLDKASDENERSAVLMRDTCGRHIAFAQIAGLVARRIVNHLKEGQQVKVGERYGLIRFGSRAEIFMPPGTQVRVKAGDFVRCGQTEIARLPAATTPRTARTAANVRVVQH